MPTALLQAQTPRLNGVWARYLALTFVALSTTAKGWVQWMNRTRSTESSSPQNGETLTCALTSMSLEDGISRSQSRRPTWRAST